MIQVAYIKNQSGAIAEQFRRWLHDRSGLAAIEFALMVPILLTLYMGAAEVSHVLTLDRKVTSIASATADLVAQEKEINQDKIDDIFKAASSMITPYDEAPVSIIVTAIEADPDDGKTTVAWSDAHNGAAKTTGAAIEVPTGLVEPGGFVILTEIAYLYDPIIGEFIKSGFTLEDKFYTRPRRTRAVIRQ